MDKIFELILLAHLDQPGQNHLQYTYFVTIQHVGVLIN
jgi:hypothetical protein